MPDHSLKRLIRRYQNTTHRAGIPEHTRRAYSMLVLQLAHAQSAGQVLHLDSCCGVGASTVRWAQQHPEAFVVGVDKSEYRLSKHSHYQIQGVNNYHVVRADCAALWRLMVEGGWRFEQHNLWYPNPWPKKTQRQRRWYAMPALVHLVRLQRSLSVRSNGAWYLEDFAWALRWWGLEATLRPLIIKGQPMTPFELKYLATGQALWVLECAFPSKVDVMGRL